MRLTPLSRALCVLAPLLVVVVPAVGGLPLAALTLEAVVGLLLVAYLSARPAAAVIALLAYLPLQQLSLALLLSAGGPVPVVRALGFAKEVVVAALVVAALRARSHRPLDRLDLLALGLVVLVTLYLVAPLVLPGVFADVPFSVRAFAWRSNALFLVGFLAARRVRWEPTFLRTAATVVIGVAVVAAACAMVELLAPQTWSRFLIDDAHIRIFRAVIFDVHGRPTDELVHTVVGGRDVIRVGSVALSPIVLGFLLLPGLALALDRVLAGRRPVLLTAGWAVLVTAAVVATLTRSAVLAAGVVVLVTFGYALTRRRPGRVQLAVGGLLLALVVGPFVATSTLAERASSSFSGDISARGHKQNSLEAVRVVLTQPLGRGLGTGPAAGQRYDVAQRVTSENAYLQVGAEVGVAAMLLFVLLVVAVLRALARRARQPGEHGDVAAALLAAGTGLALGGMFLHVWLDFPTALTFWLLAGVVLTVPTADTSEDLAAETLVRGTTPAAGVR